MTGPAIILIQPQLSENIGTTARAMLNTGLSDLRLVRPREHWLEERARRACSGADQVLEAARAFDTTAEAVADLHRVWATTGRDRYMVKPQHTPRQAAAAMHQAAAESLACGVLFGPERTGLENDDVVLADTVLSVPLNPVHSSLNLAQAVLIVGYEWYQGSEGAVMGTMTKGAQGPATKGEMLNFFNHLEAELDACGFLRLPDKRPSMVRNIRNIFQRAQPTEQELRTLHGVVAELVTWRQRKGEGRS